MAYEAVYQYQHSADQMFEAALQVLTLGPMQMKGANPNTGVLEASTLWGLATYGERVRLYVEATGPNTSVVHFRSALNYGWGSWGRNQQNVELVHKWIEIYLNLKAARTPGWFADPFGRVQFRYFDGRNFLDENNAPMVATLPRTTPAGWYPNPEVPNQWRYWDGRKWTDHIAPR